MWSQDLVVCIYCSHLPTLSEEFYNKNSSPFRSQHESKTQHQTSWSTGQWQEFGNYIPLYIEELYILRLEMRALLTMHSCAIVHILVMRKSKVKSWRVLSGIINNLWLSAETPKTKQRLLGGNNLHLLVWNLAINLAFETLNPGQNLGKKNPSSISLQQVWKSSYCRFTKQM